MPDFILHAKYGLFTYSQCGELDPIDVSNHFTSLGAECIVAREDHADGGTHLHVFADFERKRKFRGATTFDVGGHHPNIVPSRGNPGSGWDYATKDGCIVAGGLERPSNRSDGNQANRTSTIMADLVSIDDAEEFWSTIRQVAPGLLLRSFTSISAYASWRFRPRVQEYETPSSVCIDDSGFPELLDWKRENMSINEGVGVR